MDKGDKRSQIDKRVKSAIEDEDAWRLLKAEWNKIHRDNPVDIEDDDDDSKAEENE